MSSRPGRPIKLAASAPAFTRTAAELNEHVAGLGEAMVAEVLRVAVSDLAPMLEGRALPPRHRLQRLRVLRNGEKA